MTQPFLSAICLTYGRPAHLEEAIACFLAQDYTGPKELLVLNTFPGHQLTFDAPNVRIVNLPVRPPSLGQARNAAIELAAGTHLVTWDDDDLYLPHHLSTVAKYFGDFGWIWLSKQFYAEAAKIRRIVQGSANVVSFTKEAWQTVGQYSAMGTGEDRDFVGRLTSKVHGARIEIPPSETSFIYCWANGVHHISGLGDDPPGRMSSYKRAEMALTRLVRLRKVPLGPVLLKPRLKQDYAALCRAYVSKLGPAPVAAAPISRDAVGIVLLGRYGDIINILPVCRHIALHHKKPHLIVSREFAPLLEGVSYVEPYPVELGYGQLNQALPLAKRNFRYVLNAQIWGIGHQQERHCDSFNRESWRNLGFLKHFDDKSWRPVFDRRNFAREAALYNKLSIDGLPMLLVALDGVSSPLPGSANLLKAIQAHFTGKCRVVDLKQVKAERIFDILGLMDRAAAFVTIDSALLHLAAGSAVPTVALTNPRPWLGSSVRANCVARLPYNEVHGQFTPVLAAIEQALARGRISGEWQFPDTMTAVAQPPRVIHAVEKHAEKDRAALVRKQRAQKTWAAFYQAGASPCYFEEPYPRSSKDINDKRTLPYLKDVLSKAMADAADNDIIVLTNDDNGLSPELVARLRYHVPVFGPCCSFRQDTRPSPRFSIGRDLFAFTKGWLTTNWDKIPDFILGAPEWDWCLACIVRLEYGIKSTRRNIEGVMEPAEIPTGYVTHLSHTPKWSVASNTPAVKHNKKLFADWLAHNLPDFFLKAVPPEIAPNSGGTVKQTLVVRRSGAIGDALAASFVADQLIKEGHDVTFQCDPSIHPVFAGHPTVRALAAPTGPTNVELDGAYENHPQRRELHFAAMFADKANADLIPFGLSVKPTNFAPRLIRSNKAPTGGVERLPRPWIMICPKSNSWINRSIPKEVWAEAARMMEGTAFWIGQDQPPDGIHNLHCQTIASMVGCLSFADLLVTVDTGPMHVAAALGVPVVAIEQSSAPELHLSDQRDFIVVRPPLDCLNCQQPACPIDAANPPCHKIDPAAIAGAVNTRLLQLHETISCVIAVYKPEIHRLNRCLTQVLPQVSEVIVVGDMETPWPLAGALQDQKIKYVRKNGVKTGYGKKQNFGARHSYGKYILQLNDDCYLDYDVVTELKRHMKPDVGMVSHLLRYPNGLIQYAGKHRGAGSMGFGHMDHKKKVGKIRNPIEQESVCGASVLLRRDVFFQVDGFDEDYYLYADDDDLAMKFRQAGYRIMFTPHAVGIHEEHCSSSITPQWQKIMESSAAHFAKKWRSYFLKNKSGNTLGTFA